MATGLRSLIVRITAIVGAISILALAGFVSMGTAGAQVGGAIYSGSFQPVQDGCGGGSLTLRLDAAGANVEFITVDGALFSDIPIDGLAIPLVPPIAIGGDGSFSQTFEQIPGVPITVSGAFNGSDVSGHVQVPILGCSPTFTASTDGGSMPIDEMLFDDDDDERKEEDTDSEPSTEGAIPTEADVVSAAMPSAGTGPLGESSSWATVIAALALLGLTLVGVALPRVRTKHTSG